MLTNIFINNTLPDYCIVFILKFHVHESGNIPFHAVSNSVLP